MAKKTKNNNPKHPPASGVLRGQENSPGLMRDRVRDIPAEPAWRQGNVWKPLSEAERAAANADNGRRLGPRGWRNRSS